MILKYGATLLVLALVACHSTRAQTPDDEAAIRARLTAYGEARRGGDGHAQAQFYTVDADSWLSGTRRMTKGRAEIEREIGLPSDADRQFRIEVEGCQFSWSRHCAC